ncbi:MAG: FtsX-like permease family protein [Planctomycetota bacterium]
MVGDALHRKLWRDVRRHWAEFLAAAAVILCATCVYVSLRTVYVSLVASRDAYYSRYNFPEFWIHLEKAPQSALKDVDEIDGVWRVRGRIVEDVPLEVEGNEGAVVGRFISMSEHRRDMMSDIHLVTGSYFPGAAAEEVIVNRRFCEANDLRVGDTFQATINERKETLRIVGTAYSPEYVYTVRTVQQFAPTDRDFAIIFARESFVEDAFDMTNAFNNVIGLLRPGADVDRVLDRAEEALDEYGVYVNYGRGDQVSNRFLLEELKGVRTSARIIPGLFLIVAAIVVHIIVRRMTEQQRTQIGLMCALGYSKPRVVAHYVSYALVIALLGTAGGVVAGYLLAGQWVQVYNRFFRFPALRVVLDPRAVLIALALSAGMCGVGAARSAWKVLRIDPAVAIRPAPPQGSRSFHGGPLAGLWRRLPLIWRITLRNCLRARSRALFSVFGVAVAMMMLVVGVSMNDFFEWIMDYQFGTVDRSDARVDFAVEEPEAAALEIAKLDGVHRAEGILQVAGELRNGWRKKYVALMGLPRQSRLYRVFDTDGNRIPLPKDGLLVPKRVAEMMHLSRGDTVMLDPYLKDKDERPAVVRGVVEQYIGLELYADREYLARLLRDGPLVNGAVCSLDRGRTEAVMGRMDDLPGISAVSSTRRILSNFREQVKGLMNVAILIQTVAAAIIAFAVIYNATAVSIAEQERDLACMASLGYEREDVARIATNDIMPLGIIGIIIGAPAAYAACLGIARAYETELYKLPVVIYPQTYLRAAVLVLVFLLLARWVSKRRVHGIDIVRRLKTRE